MEQTFYYKVVKKTTTGLVSVLAQAKDAQVTYVKNKWVTPSVKFIEHGQLLLVFQDFNSAKTFYETEGAKFKSLVIYQCVVQYPQPAENVMSRFGEVFWKDFDLDLDYLLKHNIQYKLWPTGTIACEAVKLTQQVYP